MTATKQNQFGLMGIPLTCSLFLEPALKRYNGVISPMSSDITKFVHEWNRALLDTVKKPEFHPYLGEVGYKTVSKTLQNNKFPTSCVDKAKDIHVQSLHYALRFSKSIDFLQTKIKSGLTHKFIDFGCGFSPTAAAISYIYTDTIPYCIDIPEIIDVYQQVANLVGVTPPQSIEWKDIPDVKSDTIIALGVFPYMDKQDQIEHLHFINNNIASFLLEIKYNNTKKKPANQKVFNLKELQQLKMQVENAQNLEMAVIQNALQYLHKFISAVPDRRYFIASERSLFLSR